LLLSARSRYLIIHLIKTSWGSFDNKTSTKKINGS
jgi:hypothetical protein